MPKTNTSGASTRLTRIAASVRGGMVRPGTLARAWLAVSSPREPRSSTTVPVTAASSMNSSPSVSKPR